MFKAKQAYLQTQITTTSQGELVVMLYDGAIKFLQRAKEKMEEQDFAEKGILISKALDVIQELDSSLNMEKGGELSTNLHSLYVYAQGRLLQANLKMKPDYVEEVINMLSSLREAFASIANSPEAIQAQKEAPEQMPVNVSQFRDTGPFGINEVRQTAPAQAATASASFRAKAYQQQAAAFNPASAAQQSDPAVAPAPAQAEKPAAAQTTAQSPQPGQPAASAAGSQQINPQPAEVPEAKAEPVAQNPQAAALTGFARQMINNSLYKKMAINNTVQATEE